MSLFAMFEAFRRVDAWTIQLEPEKPCAEYSTPISVSRAVGESGKLICVDWAVPPVLDKFNVICADPDVIAVGWLA